MSHNAMQRKQRSGCILSPDHQGATPLVVKKSMLHVLKLHSLTKQVGIKSDTHLPSMHCTRSPVMDFDQDRLPSEAALPLADGPCDRMSGRQSELEGRLEDTLSRIATETQEIKELEQQLTDGEETTNQRGPLHRSPVIGCQSGGNVIYDNSYSLLSCFLLLLLLLLSLLLPPPAPPLPPPLLPPPPPSPPPTRPPPLLPLFLLLLVLPLLLLLLLLLSLLLLLRSDLV